MKLQWNYINTVLIIRNKKPNSLIKKLRKINRSHQTSQKRENDNKKNSKEISELEDKINAGEDHKINNWFFKRLITEKNSEKIYATKEYGRHSSIANERGT